MTMQQTKNKVVTPAQAGVQKPHSAELALDTRPRLPRLSRALKARNTAQGGHDKNA